MSPTFANAPTAAQVPAPTPQAVVAIPPRKGLVIALMLGDLIFFIPSMWAVIFYYNKYMKAARAGDAETARKSLKAIKLWGFIGMGIGILIFILYVVAHSGS